MKLSAPKQLTFCISVVLLIVGIIAKFINIPFLSNYSFWIVTIAGIILTLGCFLNGL